MNKILFSAFVLLFLYSCTTTRKIGTSAERQVLNDPALKTSHVGISIFEPATNKYWYNHQGDKYFVPASNIKLPTCYAAMKFLGDSITAFNYVVDGETIYIEPTGDPTFLHPDFKNQPAFDLLKQYPVVLVNNSAFRDEHLGSGWSWSDYTADYMAQRSGMPVYGNVAKFNWKNNSVDVMPSIFQASTTIAGELNKGITVDRPWDDNKFSVINGSSKKEEVPYLPDDATLLQLLSDTLKKKVEATTNLKITNQVMHSQALDSMLRLMMYRSDNFFAEQSLLMVSSKLLGIMNDSKVIDTLLKTVYSDLPQKPRWVDGSGLSRYNLFSPQDFVAILNKMKNDFGMERMKRILPTGNTGTLSNYYKNEVGYLYAKTGSLSGVVALSGYLYTKKNKLLLFSVLVNNHNTAAAIVRRAVEKFIEGIREKY